MFDKKIPNNKPIEIYEENNFIDEELVEIPSDCGIVVEMQYPLLGMEHSINKCFVRKEVFNRLLLAKKYLPKGITFKILDAYRPIALQQEIYNKYKPRIIENFHLEKLSELEQNNIIMKYVSLPDNYGVISPLHTTGGAIDLTLVYEDTLKELDMGVKFDGFSDLTDSCAYEKEGMNSQIRNNRRILYWSMINAGFTNLPSEIWHYDYGDRAWAFYNNMEAIYNFLALPIDKC
jgi:D-alanyl-D-alanine dipeptidase